MADIDSDEEVNLEDKPNKKKVYTKATRGLQPTKKTKTDECELNADEEITYEDDDEYYKKFMAAKEKEDDDEDLLQMQLTLEKEEAERKLKAEVKTKKDEDGTEYEWDPVVKGWFPKVIYTKIYL